MRYRCFCMTEDGRIITGAFIEANSALAARSVAEGQWAGVKGFHHAEVWLGRILLSGGPLMPYLINPPAARPYRAPDEKLEETVMHPDKPTS